MGVQTTFEAAPGRDKYRCLRKLAAGGMGEVHLAVATGLGGFERLVVIKRIRRDLARDPAFVTMFLQEARIAAQLHHANIVQVFDVDMKDGEVFCAMEFLHGQNLSAVIRTERRRGRSVPLEVCLAVVSRVCDALHYAHQRCDSEGRPLGLVHRDVTPQNVFVTYDGSVKVIDFGIARAAKQAGQTRVGVLKGKPGYMSPEQCRCQALDGRSDVFSVGVMLYELTTSRLPWLARNEWEYLKETAEGRPLPPHEVRPDYPPALEAIVLRALAATPEERFPTAGAMLEAIEAFAREEGLDGSQTVLSRYMAQTFAGELAAWQAARRAGLSLEQHLTRSLPGPGLQEPPPTADLAAHPAPSVFRGRVAASRRAGLLALSAAGGLALLVGLGLAARSLWSRPAPPKPPPTVAATPRAPGVRPPAPAVAAPPASRPAVPDPGGGTPARRPAGRAGRSARSRQPYPAARAGKPERRESLDRLDLESLLPR